MPEREWNEEKRRLESVGRPNIVGRVLENDDIEILWLS